MQISPIIIKDLKLKMRDFKTTTLTMRYLLVLGFIQLVVFIPHIINRKSYELFLPQIGLNTFVIMCITQYIMVIVITPFIIESSIVAETENNSIDLILCTRYSTFSFVAGKALVTVLHIFLLIVTSLPLMAVIFLYGGLNYVNIIMIFILYLFTSLFIACISLFYITLIKNSSLYKILTYVTSIILIIVTNIILFKNIYIPMLSGLNPELIPIKIPWSFSFNPLYGFGSVIDSNSVPFIGDVSDYSGRIIMPMLFGIEIKPWILNIGIYLIVSNIFLGLSSRKIRPIKRKLFF